MQNQANPRFRFFRAGHVDQLKISVPADLEAVENLDTKLWVTTSMPTAGIDFDAKTLAFIDTNSDGRIRVPEVKAAVKFVRENLKNTAPIFDGNDVLELENLADSALAALAGTIFSGAKSVSLEEIEKTFAEFSAKPFSGNGTISADCAGGNAEIAAMIADICAACGNDKISADDVKKFAADATAKIAWECEITDENREKIFPFGAGTAAAFASFKAVEAKIDDFFARTKLANFDPASVAALNPPLEISAGTLTGTETENLPLAKIVAGTENLNLRAGINPAWTAKIADFCEKICVPAKLENLEISEKIWLEIKAKFAPFADYISREPKSLKNSVPATRLAEILAANPIEKLAPLFARDAQAFPQRDALQKLDKLAHFSRDLVAFLHNYISFEQFYNRDPKTVFLNGKLYIDGRALSLCINVADAGTHSAAAGTASNAYLIYAQCTRKSDAKTQTICAMLGDGDSKNLRVGMNGIFVDKSGADWDAVIVKLVEQSISLRQAFWAPYVKVGQLIGKQINNFVAEREKKVDEKLSANVATAGTPTPAGTQKNPFDISRFMGVIAAAGLALGAIGGALAGIGTLIATTPWWTIFLVVAGAILLISLPSVFLTALKLRRRSISPILNANSWAINTNARISIRLCRQFTELPRKPAGTEFVVSTGTKIFAGTLLAAIVIFVLAALFCPWCREKLGIEERVPESSESSESSEISENSENSEISENSENSAAVPAN